MVDKQYRISVTHSKNSHIKVLPYIISVVLVFQVPLQILIVDDLHLYLLFAAEVYLLFSDLSARVVINQRLFLLVVFICIWIFVSAIMLPSLLIPIIGALDYLLPIVFWMLFFEKYKRFFSIDKYCRFCIWIGAIIALFGVYQRFADPTLFGIMSQISSYYSDSVVESVSVFRISSFFSSTQSYSLFVGFSTILLLVSWQDYRIKIVWKYFLLTVLILGGLLAGGKVYGVLVGLCILLLVTKIMISKKPVFNIKTKMMIERFLFILAFGAVAMVFKNKLNNLFKVLQEAVERIFLVLFNYEEFFRQESARASIMSRVFSSDLLNLVFGHGLGTSSYSAYNVLGHIYTFKQVTVESYPMSWWYEMGIPGIIAFVLTFGGALITSLRKHMKISIILICLVAVMFFTPAFYSVSLLPIWGLFLYPYYFD